MPRTAAVLISRQPLEPSGKTPWVKACVDAVSWAEAQGYTLAVSCGLLSWDIILTAALDTKIPVRLFVPVFGTQKPENAIDSVRQRFDPDFGVNITIELVHHQKKEQCMRLRDRLVVEAADLLIPVSIRPGGFFSEVVDTTDPARMNENFRVAYLKRKNPLAYTISQNDLNTTAIKQSSGYLIHWTRTAHGPWPTENDAEFCRAIIGGDDYPRTAFDTLTNMLFGGVIKAGPKHMPGKTNCVCFSAAEPESFVALMSWRKRYRHMSFEPYGIGIRNETANRLGIRPVVYCDTKTPKTVASDSPWLLQSTGVLGNWRSEQEYRHEGDVNLDVIPREEIACFCRTLHEARILARRFKVTAYPLLKN